MKKGFLCWFFVLTAELVFSQLHEIGVFAGGSNYLGDVGSEYYIRPNKPAVGIIYKRNINTRMSIRASYTYTTLYANDAASRNPARKARAWKFPKPNPIQELALGMEFNFVNYPVGRYKHSPYLFGELLLFKHQITDVLVTGEDTYDSKISTAIPFGLGYKAMLGSNLSMGLELRARYTLDDDLDYRMVNEKPATTDWYFLTGISLTYTYGRPPCYTPSF
ncbi:MAG: DUF6089 family protein [Lutibacter sp.]|nr:DUF6089 family protein [Lutibacter sp.]